MSSLKEFSIREYISKIDFNNDDWKLSKLKEDMRRFLGEEPGIDVIYKKDVMVNEFSGELKSANIILLISYLMLIRTKKNINILFLDEVFSSIDLDNISNILNLLKFFANEYNINIFVVHHALLNEEMFDRIIKIEKNIFSTIEEIQIK